MRARDTQRSKVYNWEVAWRDEREMTLPECRALVQRVFADYGKDAPHVSDGRGRSSGCYKPGWHEIALPKQLRRTYAVLHECAHGLLRLSTEAWHGPRFARLLINLMARYGGASASEMRAHATARRVKVAAQDDVPQPLPTRQVRAARRASTRAHEAKGRRMFHTHMRDAAFALNLATTALPTFDAHKAPSKELRALRDAVIAFNARYPHADTREPVAASDNMRSLQDVLPRMPR